MFSLKSIIVTSLVSLITISCGPTVDAGGRCPCSNGSVNNGAAFAPIPASPLGVPVYQQAPAYRPLNQGYGANDTPYGMRTTPLLSQPYINYSPPVPPPGTIGKTYRLPSRPVPVEKHPRVGMIDVKVVGAESVIVHDMNAMRTEDTIDGFRDAKDPNVWHFESKPLYPGLDHVYRVQANFKTPDGKESSAERYVRLIMGRVVELKFSTENLKYSNQP